MKFLAPIRFQDVLLQGLCDNASLLGSELASDPTGSRLSAAGDPLTSNRREVTSGS